MHFYDQVYRVVRCIPSGCVATYGQIARLLGQPHAARTVGWALQALPEGSGVPWQRVVNSAGCISPRIAGGVELQRALLRHEGVRTDAGGCLDLDRFRWSPPASWVARHVGPRISAPARRRSDGG